MMMHSWLITLMLVVGLAALHDATLPVADSQIVDAVLSAMGRFLHSRAIQSTSITMLMIACSRSEPALTHAARVGASAALAAALAHHGPEALQKEIASISSRIPNMISKAPPSVAVATLRHAVAAFRKYPTEDGAYQSLRFLRELARHDAAAELVPLFLSENVLALTMDAMRAHPRALRIQFNGCCLLGGLLVHDAQMIDAAVEAGAIEAAVQVLRRSNLVAAGRKEMPDDFNFVPPPQFVAIVIKLMTPLLPHDAAQPQQQRRMRAVHAGALPQFRAAPVAEDAVDARDALIAALQGAAEAHAATLNGAACDACDALRAAGGMCALPGCVECAAAGNTVSASGRLQVCSVCRRVAYCCAAHQRLHWRAHKKQCHAAESK